MGRRKNDLDMLAARLGGHLPRFAIHKALSALLAGRCLALCLHRVTFNGPSASRLSVEAETLDDLILLLRSTQPTATGWLSVTFDDGYDDAARYVASRAPLFPDVKFVVFVCPEKVLRRAGFRWDLTDAMTARGTPLDVVQAVAAMPMRLDFENTRPELRSLGDEPRYQLATTDTLRALSSFENVTIGNHSDLHAIATSVPLALIREDYRRSAKHFEALLGFAPLHFAFPFGTPSDEFDATHVAAAREHPYAALWSTEARSFRVSDQKPSAVLPRCPIVGLQSVDSLAGWLAAKLLNERVRRARSLAV